MNFSLIIFGNMSHPPPLTTGFDMSDIILPGKSAKFLTKFLAPPAVHIKIQILLEKELNSPHFFEPFFNFDVIKDRSGSSTIDNKEGTKCRQQMKLIDTFPLCRKANYSHVETYWIWAALVLLMRACIAW